MSHQDTTDEASDLVPPMFRTVCYVVGTFLSLGVAPALLAADLPVAAGVIAPIAGAALALAVRYRPTR